LTCESHDRVFKDVHPIYPKSGKPKRDGKFSGFSQKKASLSHYTEILTSGNVD
jgi:hypothetical protein